MSASAYVLQLVRAHYRRDEGGFAHAAGALGRQAKSASIREEIENLTRRGFSSTTQPRQLGEAHRKSLAPLLPPPKSSSLLVRLAPVTFSDLLLSQSLQDALDELTEELEYRQELAERELSARSRLLFYGPPGNGKSAASSAFANTLGMEAYLVSVPELVSSYMGATGKNLAELFRDIRDDMVVVFDELDAIGTKRGSTADGAGREQNAIVTSLLTLMDQHKEGVIIGTTNRLDILDPALKRRFDEHLLFPAPSEAQKANLAARLVEKYGVESIDVADCENLDEVTKRVKTHARRSVMAEIKATEHGDTDGT